MMMIDLVLSHPDIINSENPPLENCLKNWEFYPEIRIEATENISPDTKNAFLAAREDTNCIITVARIFSDSETLYWWNPLLVPPGGI